MIKWVREGGRGGREGERGGREGWRERGNQCMWTDECVGWNAFQQCHLMIKLSVQYNIIDLCPIRYVCMYACIYIGRYL